jgi:hypothetical protein
MSFFIHSNNQKVESISNHEMDVTKKNITKRDFLVHKWRLDIYIYIYPSRAKLWKGSSSLHGNLRSPNFILRGNSLTITLAVQKKDLTSY